MISLSKKQQWIWALEISWRGWTNASLIMIKLQLPSIRQELPLKFNGELLQVFGQLWI